MAPSRRKLHETVEATLTPPNTLAASQVIARVLKAEGNNLYSVELPSAARLLVELPARFRSTIWLKRGGFVVVDTQALAGRDNKLGGEITNVVRDERQWRKESYWPGEFAKRRAVEASGSDTSPLGKPPPSNEDDEERARKAEEELGESR
jgi:probable RNA-binding protein EIF1AD